MPPSTSPSPPPPPSRDPSRPPARPPARDAGRLGPALTAGAALALGGFVLGGGSLPGPLSGPLLGAGPVQRVSITLSDASGPAARDRAAPGFEIDVSTRGADPAAGADADARGPLPDWIEPTTRRGAPGEAEQVIVTMGRDASASMTADHVVLVRGDESVVLGIGGDAGVDTPSDAPGWVSRADPAAPVVARFGRAGRIEIAARGIRVQRRGPG